MITAEDLKLDAIEILGYKEEDKIFRRLTDAQGALANWCNWDPSIGYMDICVGRDRCVALPPTVQTPLALNIGGSPARFRNEWFEFHLNGPGSPECEGCPCDWVWDNRGDYPTIESIKEPSKLMAIVEHPEDTNIPIRVYGLDELRRPLRTLSCEAPMLNRSLTAPFTQPNPMTFVTINVNNSDSLLKYQEIIIRNSTTRRNNFYRVQSRPSMTTLTLMLDPNETSEASGTVIPQASTIMSRTWEDGILVPTVAGYPMPTEEGVLVSQVTRIRKSRQSTGFIRVVALDPGRNDGQTLLTYLYPKNLEQVYRRILVARSCTWVRMRYKKRNTKIESWQDEIMIDSKLGFLFALRSVEALRDNNTEVADSYKAQAVQFLSEEQIRNRPPGPLEIQVNDQIGVAVTENIQ